MDLLRLAPYKKVFQVDCFSDEFAKAVTEHWRAKKPFERYQRKLMEDLAVLEDQGENAVKLPQFEQLSQTKYRMYSIRHPKTKKNVRVIYVIEEGDIILLTAFLEKNDSDYFNGIKRAEKRYKELMS